MARNQTTATSPVVSEISSATPYGKRPPANKNVCHFSVGSLRSWNLQDVLCVGFSFQASGFSSRCGISSSSTVCCCKAAAAPSAAGVSECVCCTFIIIVLGCIFCVCRFGFVCALRLMASFAVSAAVSPQLCVWW